MNYILHIDTALESASVCLSLNGEAIAFASNDKKRDHAAWLQPAIQSMIAEAGITLQQLNAIAVSNGPGSYTGLRIGLSSAKGICYALGIPLIAISTLEAMAHSVTDVTTEYICPMIDARRMEVYTAVYDNMFATIKVPQAMILTASSFEEILNNNSILFFGNGSIKFKPIVSSKNAIFKEVTINAKSLIKIADKRFHIKDFNSLAYTEPFYIKEFHTSVR